ncbi:MAG: hypothetical protein WDN00_17550 [Limisphaerales bacterium]
MGNRGKNEPQQPGCYERAVAGFKWESDYLYFTVRGTVPDANDWRIAGVRSCQQRETADSGIPDGGDGVIFSDGIEKDFLEFNSGTQAVIGIAEKRVCWWSNSK